MLESERKWYDKKRFILPMLFIIYPIGVIFLFTGKAFPAMKTKLIVGGVFGVIFMLMLVADNLEQSSKLERENQQIALVESHIQKGNLEEALIQIDKYLAKSSSSTLQSKKEDIEKARSIQEIELTLATMNDARFEKLKNGTLNEKFFKDESINAFFIKQLSANSDRKKELTEAWEFKKQQQDLARQQAERKKKIEESFHPFDDSHIGLVRLIKSRMNDPDSFEHLGTAYSDNGDYLLVKMNFRGTNGFGAKVRNTAIAKCDVDGNVLSYEIQ